MLFLIKWNVGNYDDEYVSVAETEHIDEFKDAGIQFVEKTYYTQARKSISSETSLRPAARKDEDGNLIFSDGGEPVLYTKWVTTPYTEMGEYKKFIEEHADDIVEENVKDADKMNPKGQIRYWQKHTDLFAVIETLEQLLSLGYDMLIEQDSIGESWYYYDDNKEVWHPFWIIYIN